MAKVPLTHEKRPKKSRFTVFLCTLCNSAKLFGAWGTYNTKTQETNDRYVPTYAFPIQFGLKEGKYLSTYRLRRMRTGGGRCRPQLLLVQLVGQLLRHDVSQVDGGDRLRYPPPTKCFLFSSRHFLTLNELSASKGVNTLFKINHVPDSATTST